MRIEKVLERLGKLLNRWGIPSNAWVLVAQYAHRLLGYDVRVRKGHLNVLVNKVKLPWDAGEALETHPPEKTEFAKEFRQFIRDTGFEFDISPVSPNDFKRKVKNSIPHTLPSGNQVRIQTMQGALEELENLLSMCTDEGWGKEKGARLLPAIEDQRMAILRKGEVGLAKAYEDLIQKYSHLRKRAASRIPKGLSKVKEVRGIPASQGIVRGKARVILDPSKVENFEKGDILITSMTSPKLTPSIQKAVAIVTDEGGRLCHAAIVSREFGIPCIVGTKNATEVFNDGDLVELDAYSGIARKL